MLEFSVIIPCYRDETMLDRLLTQLHALQNAPKEIIVVDGANNSSCRAVCVVHHAQWLPAIPCRGEQLLTGAASAQGNIFWFLHADTILPKNPIQAMTLALASGAVGGYFRFQFNAPRDWPVPMLEAAIALRCRVGVPYGDQGIFVKRDHYFAAGGHAPWPLFEEAPLVRNLRKLGHFQSLAVSLLVDPRRWQRDGWWRRTWHNRKLALAFICGIPPEKLARQYRNRNEFK
jgi:rSAM/selenodomain-associated transferase 2